MLLMSLFELRQLSEDEFKLTKDFTYQLSYLNNGDLWHVSKRPHFVPEWKEKGARVFRKNNYINSTIFKKNSEFLNLDRTKSNETFFSVFKAVLSIYRNEAVKLYIIKLG